PPPFLQEPPPGSFRPDHKMDPEGVGIGPPREEHRFEPELEPPFSKRIDGDPKFRPGRPGERWPPREIRLSAATLSLFDETGTNAAFFTIWSREGSVQKRSTNA